MFLITPYYNESKQAIIAFIFSTSVFVDFVFSISITSTLFAFVAINYFIPTILVSISFRSNFII